MWVKSCYVLIFDQQYKPGSLWMLSMLFSFMPCPDHKVTPSAMFLPRIWVKIHWVPLPSPFHKAVMPIFQSHMSLPRPKAMTHLLRLQGPAIMELLSFSGKLSLLRLSTPNIVSTDLVVFPLLSLSYQINLWQPRCPYASLFFTSYRMHPSPPIHLRAVHGYVLLFFASILPLPCGCLMFSFLSIPWPCLMHAYTSCY